MRARTPTAMLLALVAPVAMAGTIEFNPMATGGLSSLTAPGLTDAGEGVFGAFDEVAGSYGLYSSAAGGPLLTIIGSNFLVGPASPPSVGPGGSVAFLGADAAGEGLYTTSSRGGGVLLTIRGENFGVSSLASPSASSNGTVVFSGVDDATGAAGVYAADADGNVITINGSNFGKVSSTRVSDTGTVAFSAVDSLGEAGLYMTSGGGVLLTIKGESFGQGISSVDMNGNDDVVFVGVDELGATGLYRADGGGLKGTIPLNWPQAASTVGLNDNGLVVAGLSSLARSESLESIAMTDLAGSFQSTIISVGDPLAGSTVTSLSFSPDGLNNANQLAFFAALADGSSGLFIATIPAPGVAGAMVLGAGAMFGRRRRG